MSLARWFAQLLRTTADRLEPPAELLDRGRVERDASRARHPSVTGELYANGGWVAPVVDLPSLRTQEGDQWPPPS